MLKKLILLALLLLGTALLLALAGCESATVYSRMEITSPEGAGIKTIYAKIPRDHLSPQKDQDAGDVNSAMFPKGFKPVAEFLEQISPADSVVNFVEEKDYWVYSMSFTFRDIDDYNAKMRAIIRDDLYSFSNLAPAEFSSKKVKEGYEVTFREQTDVLQEAVLTYLTDLFGHVDIFEFSRRGKGAAFPINAFKASSVKVKIAAVEKLQPMTEQTIELTGILPSNSSGVVPQLPQPTVWPDPYVWPQIAPYWPTVKYDSQKLDYAFAVFPDTQGWTEYYPQIFDINAQWVADHAQSDQIKFALHVGDITDDNIPLQWSRGKKSMSLLNGIVPYALAGGNHDYPTKPEMVRDYTLFNQFFPVSEYEDTPTFGGVFEAGKIDNTYHLFHAGEHDYLVLALEFGPRDEVLDWANEIIAKYPNHRAIILTHAYLYRDRRLMSSSTFTSASSYEYAKNPGETVNDGDDIWNKVVSKHKNMFMVICGHVHEPQNPEELIYNVATGEQGNKVIQLLADAKGFQNAIFLLRFSNDGNTIGIEMYSPFFDAHAFGRQQILLDYNKLEDTFPAAKPAVQKVTAENKNAPQDVTEKSAVTADQRTTPEKPGFSVGRLTGAIVILGLLAVVVMLLKKRLARSNHSGD